MVSRGFTGFYWVFWGLTGFDWVLLGFTGFLLDCTSSKRATPPKRREDVEGGRWEGGGRGAPQIRRRHVSRRRRPKSRPSITEFSKRERRDAAIDPAPVARKKPKDPNRI